MEKDYIKIIEERYGNIPPRPRHLRCELICEERNFAAGSASVCELKFLCECVKGDVFFTAKLIMPSCEGKIPIFIYLAERGEVPDKFLPAEELCDRGVGVLLLDYRNITEDDESFKSGIAATLAGGRRSMRSPSKTALWAFALLRAIEYAARHVRVDSERICVIAHSHLCAAALIASMISDTASSVVLSSPYEPRLSHRFAKGHTPSDVFDFINDLSHTPVCKRLLISLSDEDAPRGEVCASLRHRNGGRYLTRGDWNYYIDFIKQ